MTEDQKRYPKRKEYLKRKVVDYRVGMRVKVVEVMGGKCGCCGYDSCMQALTAHHLNPEDKGFGLSYKGMCRKWEAVLVELRKCVLLCANCHAEVHAGLRVVPKEVIFQAQERVDRELDLFRDSQVVRRLTVN